MLLHSLDVVERYTQEFYVLCCLNGKLSYHIVVLLVKFFDHFLDLYLRFICCYHKIYITKEIALVYLYINDILLEGQNETSETFCKEGNILDLVTFIVDVLLDRYMVRFE